MLGKTIKHYEVIELIGQGGMGEVYKARDLHLDRIVALKFLPAARQDDPTARERFRQEALAASRLDHPHICTIYDFDETEDGREFISMTFCGGETLTARLAGGPLPPAEALKIGQQVASALVAAHAAGVIHRDLKPDNIALTYRGDVKIVDFGLARLADQERLTLDRQALGTLAYSSPEQTAGGEIDHRTDIWALGVVLFEMLTGGRPFTGDNLQDLISAIARAPAPALEVAGQPVPPALSGLVDRCLAKDPDHRFTSAEALGNAIELARSAYHSGGSGDLAHKTLPIPRWRPPRRARRLWSGLVAAVAVLAAVSGVAWQAGWFGHDPAGVALLPLRMVGGAEADRALVDGLSLDLNLHLMALEPFQERAWVVPPEDVRRQAIAGTDEARSRLGVGATITGTLHLQGDMVRLELQRHTAAYAGWRSLTAADERVVTGSRADLVAWRADVLAALGELAGWRPPTRKVSYACNTHLSSALDLHLRGLGLLLAADGTRDPRAALEVFATAIGADSAFASPRVGRALALRQSARPDTAPTAEAALAACRKAAALDPNLIDAHFTRGRILEETGDLPGAMAAFRRCLELNPVHGPSLSHLAECQTQIGEIEDAELTYRHLLARRPDHVAAINNYGAFLFLQGRLDEAAECFRRVVDLAPGLVNGYTNLGSVHWARGDLEAAVAMYNRALALEPDADTYRNLGTIHFYQHSFQKAADMLTAACELKPGDSELFGLAAECYNWGRLDMDHARKLYARAAALADSALAVKTGDPDLLTRLASYRAHLGQEDRAREAIGRALALESQDPYVMYSLATTHEILGDRTEALRCLEESLAGGILLSVVQDYPGLDRLRSSPEFADMIGRLQLDAAAP